MSFLKYFCKDRINWGVVSKDCFITSAVSQWWILLELLYIWKLSFSFLFICLSLSNVYRLFLRHSTFLKLSQTIWTSILALIFLLYGTCGYVKWAYLEFSAVYLRILSGSGLTHCTSFAYWMCDFSLFLCIFKQEIVFLWIPSHLYNFLMPAPFTILGFNLAQWTVY